MAEPQIEWKTSVEATAKGLFQRRIIYIDCNLSISIIHHSSSWNCQPAKLAMRRNDMCEWLWGGHGERVRVHFGAATRPSKETVMGERGKWGERSGSRESAAVRSDSTCGHLGICRNLRRVWWPAHPTLQLKDVNTGWQSTFCPSYKWGALCWHVDYMKMNKAESWLKRAYRVQFKNSGRASLTALW